MIEGHLDTKPVLVWTGNDATRDGVCYFVAQERQILTHDGLSRMMWLVWRTMGRGPRRRVGAALTLEGAKLVAEQDYASRSRPPHPLRTWPATSPRNGP